MILTLKTTEAFSKELAVLTVEDLGFQTFDTTVTNIRAAIREGNDYILGQFTSGQLAQLLAEALKTVNTVKVLPQLRVLRDENGRAIKDEHGEPLTEEV